MLQASSPSSCMETSPLFGGESFSLFGGHSNGGVSSWNSPSVPMTFDWSDYPISGHEYSYPISGHEYSGNIVDLSQEQQQQQYEHQESSHQEPQCVSVDTSPNHLKTGDESKIIPSLKKSVSWGHSLEIRTHSIILGDHPCCCDPLPLQLGWEYNDTELVSLELHEIYKKQMVPPPPPSSSPASLSSYRIQSSSSRSCNSPHRFTLLERKNLLKRVSGIKERDLVKAIQR